MPLPKDATIATVLPTLTRPENYITSVLGHMFACKREQGTASVRIGAMGEGKTPHYKVEYVVPGQKYPYPIFGVFDGRNHKPLVDEDALRDEHWSLQTLGIEEVQAVLGAVRKEKAKVTKNANRT